MAKEIEYREPQIGFLSSWTGQVVRKEGLTADYWKPHESHQRYSRRHLKLSQLKITGKISFKHLSRLYLNGVPIDWKGFDKPYHRKKVSLPTYPFQRERYWVEALKTLRKRSLPENADPLLGESVPLPTEEKLFRNEVDLHRLPYLQDHKAYENIIFPGVGYAQLLLLSGRKLFQSESVAIQNLSIRTASCI